ncbi:hypothetical protein KY311_03800 [Candidatus Woesearchaeota archaeon]|nr:hypothetical protein [Candidatus Woesearchaeota archaeon]
MWITATRAIELHNACEKAVPVLEKMLGHELPSDNTGLLIHKAGKVAKLVRDDIEKERESLPGDWSNADWDGRAGRLAEKVVNIYLTKEGE